MMYRWSCEECPAFHVGVDRDYVRTTAKEHIETHGHVIEGEGGQALSPAARWILGLGLDKGSAMKNEYGRESGTGRFCHTTDRLCTCGHPLSLHTAARGKTNGVIYQPCIVGDFQDVTCDCECFKPAKRKR